MKTSRILFPPLTPLTRHVLFLLWLVLAISLGSLRLRATVTVIDIGDTDYGDFIATTTTLTVNPPNGVPGTEITLTAKTTGITGFTVSFFLDDQPIGTGTIGADGVTQLQYTVRPLAAGPHTFRATLPQTNWNHKKEVARTISYAPNGSVRSIDVFVGTVHDVIGGSSGTASFVVVADGPPIIITPPTNQIVRAGSTVSLNTDTVGALPVFYQWRFNGNPLPTGTNPTLTLTGVQTNQAGIYSVVASNSFGVVTTSNASLTVFTVSTSLSPPQNATVEEGSTVTLAVSASSPVPLSYGWKRNGTSIPGESGPSLTLTNVQPTDAGVYVVEIADGVASVSAQVAAFAVKLKGVSLASSRWLSGGRFQFAFEGKAALNHIIAVSTNLVDWTALTNLLSVGGLLSVVDSEAARYPRRFYRVGSAPVPNMVLIPAGTFTMGSPANETDRYSDEGPQTQVTISGGFWMGKHEVTQGEYLDVMGSNPSYFKGDTNRPVEQVSWVDATNFCARLTARERAAGRLGASDVYRLPTEAEWEYGARAGSTTRFSYGDDPGYVKLGDYAWFSGNSGSTTHPVGLKLPNAWGLHDMSGNVWEWCLDWYGSYPGGSLTDPRGPATGSNRVDRGGGWGGGGRGCRSAYRNGDTPDSRNGDLGFRVVLAPGQ
ncbi:MAG: SUMF1/EgtB/PvdO family nonheme iron enzyme [Verrucomicrobiota bacterium]